MNEMQVAYCFDRNYQQHFGASLMSLLLNAGASTSRLDVHVVTSEADRAFVDRLERIARVFRASIHLVELGPGELRCLEDLAVSSAKQSYLARATWYRVLLARILPADLSRVLYLDADTIVLRDLGELFATDIGGAPLAGVIDPSNSELSARYGLRRYVNTGVLLIDLDQWRRHDLVARVLEHGVNMREQSLYADQCAVNTFFSDRIHVLDDKWNRFVTAWNERSIALDDSAILHFLTSDKPWQSWYENGLSHHYWRYLEVSPWRGAVADAPRTLDQMHRMARLLRSQGKHSEAADRYETIVAELAGRLNDRK